MADLQSNGGIQQAAIAVGKKNYLGVASHSNGGGFDNSKSKGCSQYRAYREQSNMVKEQVQKQWIKLLAGAFGHNLVGNMAKQLLSILEPLGDFLKEKIGSFNLDLSQDNIDKFAKIFEGMNK